MQQLQVPYESSWREDLMEARMAGVLREVPLMRQALQEHEEQWNQTQFRRLHLGAVS